MNLLPKVSLIIFIIIIGTSCKKENNCPDAVFPLTQVFSTLSNHPKYEDRVTYDSEVHEYKFTLSRSGRICSIGYQSHPSVSSYLIEIIDEKGNILFREDLSFSKTNTQYVEINPVQIEAGKIYTLRRTCLEYTWIDETVGRILKVENNPIGMDTLTLPTGNDLITIIDVAFYSHGDPPDNAIPFIDFGFIE